MKQSTGIWIAVGVIGLYLIFKSNNANAADQTTTGSGFDLSQFDNNYDPANVQRLLNLYNVLAVTDDPNSGQPLSLMQQQLLLSQALMESGLFTSNPNLNNVDNLNNYAGIKGNSFYPAAPGSTYADYPDIASFVGDWLRVLNLNLHGGGRPIEATGVADFISRLVSNSYFESSPMLYQAAVQGYFNQLSKTIV